MKSDKLTDENAELSIQESYVCIAPEEGRSVYKYFNSVLSKEAEQRFEEHLFLCFNCQDVIFSLDQLFGTLQQNGDELFQKSGQEADKEEAEDKKSKQACGNCLK